METASPTMVIDIAELLASHDAIKAQETTDRNTLSVLLNETRESLRPQMFAWATAGFPSGYIVQQFAVKPPTVCSDGVTRNVDEYVTFLLDQSMTVTIAAIQAVCVGVVMSYSFAGSTLFIHISKA